MRRIRYQVASSLDGCIAGPAGEFDWIVDDPGFAHASGAAWSQDLRAQRRSRGGPQPPGRPGRSQPRRPGAGRLGPHPRRPRPDARVGGPRGPGDRTCPALDDPSAPGPVARGHRDRVAERVLRRRPPARARIQEAGWWQGHRPSPRHGPPGAHAGPLATAPAVPSQASTHHDRRRVHPRAESAPPTHEDPVADVSEIEERGCTVWFVGRDGRGRSLSLLRYRNADEIRDALARGAAAMSVSYLPERAGSGAGVARSTTLTSG